MSDKPGERSGADDSVGQILTLQKQWERKEKGYKGQIAKLQSELGRSKPTQAVIPETKSDSSDSVVESKPIEATPKHYVHNSDRFCTDCGGPSPTWKDETECSTCKRPLGSIVGMKLAKACPDCGGTKFTPKRSLTEEEKKLFVQA